MKHALLALLMIGFFSACAPSSDEAVDARDKQIEEQREKQKQQHDVVEGTYSGTVSASDREIPVELRIVSIEVEDGTNSKGDPIFKYSLKGILTLMDTPDDDILLEGSFNPQTGNLVLTSPKPKENGTAKLTDSWAISATFQEQKLSGKVVRSVGTLGPMKMVQISKKADGVTAEERELRIKNLLMPFVGLYKGEVPLSSSVHKILLHVQIVVIDSFPRLNILCEDKTFIGKQDLPGVVYLHPVPKLSLGSGGVGVCPISTFNAFLTAKGLEGTLTDREGIATHRLFERTTPEKEKEEVRKKLSRFTGKFEGNLDLRDGTSVYTRLEIFITENASRLYLNAKCSSSGSHYQNLKIVDTRPEQAPPMIFLSESPDDSSEDCPFTNLDTAKIGKSEIEGFFTMRKPRDSIIGKLSRTR